MKQKATVVAVLGLIAVLLGARRAYADTPGVLVTDLECVTPPLTTAAGDTVECAITDATNPALDVFSSPASVRVQLFGEGGGAPVFNFLTTLHPRESVDFRHVVAATELFTCVFKVHDPQGAQVAAAITKEVMIAGTRVELPGYPAVCAPSLLPISDP